MWRNVRGVLFALLIFAAQPALCQTKQKLATLIENLYGPSGLIVDSETPLPDGSTHSAHFNSGFQSEFTQFNVALASQLTAVPLPSPAAGFTYSFDSATGTFKRSTQSFGPILADRAETIGRNKMAFGFDYQQFVFNSIEGLDLARIPAVFRHDDFQLGGGRADLVTTNNGIEASISQFTAFLTYGLTNRLDISLAIPIVRTRLDLTSSAAIQRIGTEGDPKVHFFRDPSNPLDPYGSHKEFSSSGKATGLGDIIVRAKGTALRQGPAGIAIGVDVRVPSGDEKDLLGSGALGVKPFVAVSFLARRVSPHINLGYQWNGKSELAGSVKTGTKVSLPDQFLYTVGADVGVNERFTLAFDLLGTWVRDSPRLFATQFTSANGTVFPDIRFARDSFVINNGAVGFKTNVAGRFLVNFNLAFKLNDAGLRTKVTPLLGMEYSF